MTVFKLKNQSEVQFYDIEKFGDGRAKALFSTRNGGVSEEGYGSLNMGLKSGDDIKNVLENINIFCRASGITADDLVFSDQVHSSNVRVVGKKDRGKGIMVESDIAEVDSLITCEKDTALCIFTADCVPLFLYDRQNNVIGLCHAGWRGIISDIAVKTISAMELNFGSKPCMISAAIGPSIRSCCFEVSEDVKAIFSNKFNGSDGIVIEREGRTYIDLQYALRSQLVLAGVYEKSITDSGLCTCCNSDKFFTYRGEGPKTGRMISILQLC